MSQSSDDASNDPALRCPTCRAGLKKRRTRTPDKCEMICGGCGETFDVCDLDTVDYLKKQS